jgi:hypothetical protein
MVKFQSNSDIHNTSTRYRYITSAIFSFEKVLERKEWPKIWSERGGVSYSNAWKKGSGLRPSRIELLEWCSITKIPLHVPNTNLSKYQKEFTILELSYSIIFHQT